MQPLTPELVVSRPKAEMVTSFITKVLIYSHGVLTLERCDFIREN